jgi:hypothetical protein
MERIDQLNEERGKKNSCVPFLRMIKLEKDISFDVEIPNQETQKVIRNSSKGIDVKTHSSLDDYFKKIETEMEKEMDT